MALSTNDTRMLLKPDTSFFRYFTDPSGKLRGIGNAADHPGAVPLANAQDRHVGLSGRARTWSLSSKA